MANSAEVANRKFMRWPSINRLRKLNSRGRVMVTRSSRDQPKWAGGIARHGCRCPVMHAIVRPTETLDQGGRSMRVYILLVWLAAGLAGGAEAQRPQMPRVRPEPCEGYCRPMWASCTRAVLRAAPVQSAPQVATVDSGQLVRVIAGERRTTKPGVVAVRRPYTLVQRLATPDDEITPPNPKRWQLNPGDTIYVVDTESDGDSYENFIWVLRGHEDTTAAFWDELIDGQHLNESAAAELVEKIEQQWWARVRTANGATGWTRPDSTWSGTSHYDFPASRCAR
jgi:hypothetical protein